jgi:autophagy-related protein 9
VGHLARIDYILLAVQLTFSRILRQENYLIALFNKDLLDLRVRFPVPHALEKFVPPRLLAPRSQILPATNPGASVRSDRRERVFIAFGHNTLTKALEWNLRFCLLGFLFDERGQVRKEFVREKRRRDLVEG